MDTDKIMEFLTRPKVMLIGGILIVFILLVGWGIGTYTDVRNKGRNQELALTRQWKTMLVNYGQFRTGFVDKLGIAREKRAAMNKILVDSVTGRYDKPGQNGAVNGQAVVSAIAEAYPDLKGLNIFDELIRDIQAGRERFAKEQAQMQDQVRSYDSWCTTGSFFHPTFVRWAGFPSNLLEAQIGDKVYHGREALDKMSQVIVGADTNQIFDSGVDKALPTN